MKWFTLTDAELADCVAYDREVSARVSGYGANYTGLEVRGRYYSGRCGETGFAQWLRSCGHHDFVWHRNTSGRSDGGIDFIIGDLTVDVKNTRSRKPKEMMVPVEQFPRLRADVLVQTRSRGDARVQVAPLGWCARAVFARYASPAIRYDTEMLVLPLRKPLISGMDILDAVCRYGRGRSRRPGSSLRVSG